MTDADRRRGTWVGRADLLRAITELRSGDARVTARTLGFKHKEPTAPPKTPVDPPKPGAEDGPRAVPVVAPPRGARSPVRLWRVVEQAAPDISVPVNRASIAIEHGSREPLTADDLGPVRGVALPERPPLMPQATLRRTLEEAIGAFRMAGTIDLDVVMGRMSRGEPIDRLPRRLLRSGAGRVMVVLDRVPRLIPFSLDQLDVLWLLHAEIVGAELEHVSWFDGPPVEGDDVARVNAVAPGLETGDVVLVLGDLGCYGSKAERRAWSRLGEALNRCGVGAVALVPVPISRWQRSLRTWQVYEWGGSDRQVGAVGWSREELAARSDKLLGLVSWTRRLEPELLRAVRMALPAGEADVGTEADLWNDPRLVRHPAGLLVPTPVRHEARARLKHSLEGVTDDPGLRSVMQRVVELVRAWHQPVARELWLDEARDLQSLDHEHAWIGPEESEEVQAFTVKLHAYVKAHEGAAPLGGSIDLRGWIRRSGRGQAREVFEHESWGSLVAETWDAVEPKDEREMPVGMPARMLPAAAGTQVRKFVVGQIGEELYVVPEGVDVDPRMSPIVTVPARARWLQVEDRAHALHDDGGRRISLPEGEVIELSTDCVEKVRLRLESKPAWARAMGRDRQGQWVQYGEHRLAWPAWARAHGEDGFGLWARFRVGEAEQRMRWIAPGTFMMGSPEGEEGRWEDEGPQHEVTLTEGYWLADTPCTQELWQAVMGENPSYFQSSRRPVEQVSWDDVQGFIAKLNEMVPGLETVLPTEAQWEHACRAGVTTATYVGDLVIRGANDAPLLDDIAWYGGNSGVGFELADGYDSSDWPYKQYPHTRAGTREVGLKRPNPWGLYDMLGNVLEWCADMQRGYGATAETDPRGTGGPKRVIRGGSWYSDARYCRAAHRLWRDPGYRNDGLGFRLSRGQGLRPATPASQPANQQQGRKQGRGTSPASPGVRSRKGA